MAFRKIELTEEEQKASMGQKWITFTAIGQRFVGRFMREQEQTGQFAKKDRKDYVFKYANPPDGSPGHQVGVADKAVVEGVVRGTLDIATKFKKGCLKENDVVRLTFTETREIAGFDKPMQICEVEIDDGVKAAAPKAAAPAPKPPPPPAPAADTDDIPF